MEIDARVFESRYRDNAKSNLFQQPGIAGVTIEFQYASGRCMTLPPDHVVNIIWWSAFEALHQINEG